MNISLTAEQERLVQGKLQSGKYRSAEQMVEIALKLLDEYERSEAEWVEEVRAKIDEAIEISQHTPPVDGESFVNNLLARLHRDSDSRQRL